MGMEHQFGQPGLIYWQNRKMRRTAGRMSLWATFITVCAVAGLVALAGQMLGWTHFHGPFMAIPAGLLLLAINAQLIAGARAALAWLAG
jgi:hypothetical protein